jgi:hypothetical protein
MKVIMGKTECPINGLRGHSRSATTARIAPHRMAIDDRRLMRLLVVYNFLWLLIYAPL